MPLVSFLLEDRNIFEQTRPPKEPGIEPHRTPLNAPDQTKMHQLSSSDRKPGFPRPIQICNPFQKNLDMAVAREETSTDIPRQIMGFSAFPMRHEMKDI